MKVEQEIDYDALAQEAMRGVVRTVLLRVQKSGLPGDHHFYIAFDTRHPGVVLSKRLKGKYTDEMTIVLQHRFWELIVSDVRFEVKLTFDGIPERLVVPFASVKVFFDPSVPYGLQFDEAGAMRDTAGSVVGINEDTGPIVDGMGNASVPAIGRDAARSGGRTSGERKRPVRRARNDKDEDGEAAAEGGRAEPQPAPRPQVALTSVTATTDADASDSAGETPAADPDNVISLDRFRKKP